jgi:DNA-directed RNA polymerase subunit F
MPQPIPLAEVKRRLGEEAAHRTLPREALLAQTHADSFARLPLDQTEKLIAELRALPFVDAGIAVKLADVLPQYPEEIRLLYAKERILLDEAQLNQLLEILAHYR